MRCKPHSRVVFTLQSCLFALGRVIGTLQPWLFPLRALLALRYPEPRDAYRGQRAGCTRTVRPEGNAGVAWVRIPRATPRAKDEIFFTAAYKTYRAAQECFLSGRNGKPGPRGGAGRWPVRVL